MRVHRSARRHGIADEDIAHAYENIMRWVQVGEDPDRYLVAGPDRAGNLIELVVLGANSAIVIHAMTLRTSTRRVLFGEEN
jgi:hypothetical protein